MNHSQGNPRRPTRWIAAVAALGLLGWIWRLRPQPEQEPARASQHLAASSAVSSAPPIGAAADPGDSATSIRTELVSSVSDSRVYLVRTVVLEPDGSLAEALPSRWRIRGAPASHSASRKNGETEFTGGEFSIDARPGTRLLVLGASLGERLISPRTPSVLLGAEPVVTLVGDLPAQGHVRVIDARRGVDLPNVLVVPWTCGERSTALPPLAALRGGCARSAPSPLALPANPEHVSYWIGASGFAWRRIEYGISSGTPVYGLEAGGNLDVDVRLPRDLSTEFVLRLERTVEGSSRVEELAEELLDSSTPLEFSGLPAGRIVARVLARRQGEEDRTVVERDVEVESGAAAELVLELDSWWRPADFGEIALALLLEAESNATALHVRIESLDSESLDTEARDERRVPLAWLPRDDDGRPLWRSGARLAGRYRVSVPPSSAALEVRVQAGSFARATLVVPALPELRLWTLDAATQTPVQVERVVWRAVDPAAGSDWNVVTARRAGEFAQLCVAPGRIEVGVQADRKSTRLNSSH